jgi:hypothetical protein
MEDFTLQSAKVIEPQKQAAELTAQVPNTEGMAVIVMHHNLAVHRNCTNNMTGKQNMTDTTNCGGKLCITCKARMEGCQMMDVAFDIDTSTAIKSFVEMKEQQDFKTATVQERIDKLSGWLAQMVQSEKKALASMGALRMSQKQAMDFLKGQTSLEYIHVTLVKVPGQAGGTGYVLYKQLDKPEYAKVLANIANNTYVEHLSVKSKAQVLECILGMGFVAQAKGCKKLDGIMDLVVYLENKLLFKDDPENMEEEEQEQRPITINDFTVAIVEIHKKLDKMLVVTEQRLEENNQNIKRARDICEEMLKDTCSIDAEMMRKKAEKNKKENEADTDKVLQELELQKANKRAEQAAEEANKQQEKDKADKLQQEMKAEEEREEKDEINKIRNHKTAEQTAPWCTNMAE